MTQPRHLVLQNIPLGDQLRLHRDLPPPDECRQLREAADISPERFAREYLYVQGVTLKSWERGARRPQFRHRVMWSLRIRELRDFLNEVKTPAGSKQENLALAQA
jgi:hypothetical protein